MKCIVCGEFVPPGFSEKTDDGKADKCVFCIRGTTIIENIHPTTFHKTVITKIETVNAYKEHIDNLKKRKNVTKFLISGVDDE